MNHCVKPRENLKHMLLMLLATCHFANGEDPLHLWFYKCHSLIGDFFKKIVIQARVRVRVKLNFLYK